MKSAGVSARTRVVVLERDLHTCQRCGRYIGVSGDYSLQHRIPRGMGGSRDLRLNLPGNLITLCGSATTGCHHDVESHRSAAFEQGYLVARRDDPTTIPVLTFQGWRLYDNDGMTQMYEPEGAHHAIAAAVAGVGWAVRDLANAIRETPTEGDRP